MDELLQKYSDLTLVAWAMKEDQITLQLLVQEHECFQKHWGGFVKERRAEDAFTIWDSGVPLSSSFAAKFRHITISDAYRFARKTYDEIQKFTDCEVFETTRSSFMGWTDKRKYDRNSRSLLFSFTKQFEFEDAERLFTMTWDAYLNGHQLEKMLFDSSARTRFEVLQVLNNDLFVARRDYKGQRIPVTLTSVQLMFRLQTATGYAFCLRTISSPEIENALEPHELLFDAYHWMHFNRLYNQFDSPAGCEVVYGGCFDDEDPLRTSHWLFEMVCSIMRWENSAIAPLFLLQS
ncbi:uncharacterized protein IUM83_11606 [Phytophthora cinnamomi]|uniref:uncharacterized protein n=1 Tax=Phytophthora cinnamomi TaxID=4785 RepID=UPI00355A77FE|nr:hypothetical protein IUM83_11606 [Phytophthora cinnamomi]